MEVDINQKIKQAITVHTEGKLEEAVAFYREILKIQPKDITINHNIAVALMDLGNLEEALIGFKKTLALTPDYVIAHYNLGITLNKLKKFNEAEISLKKTITLKPDFAEAHNMLGSTLHDLDKLDEAKVHIKKALILKPDFVEANYNLGILLNKLKNFYEAEVAFKKVIELNPDFKEVYNELGLTLYYLGKLYESEVSFKKSIKLRPLFAEAYNNLGNTVKDLGRFDDAEINCKKAIELKPNYTKAHDNLNLILQEKKLLSILQTKNINKTKLIDLNFDNILSTNPFFFNRDVEAELLSCLYKIESTEFCKTEGGPLFGIGRTTNYNLFDNTFSILKTVEEDLTIIMKQAVKSDIFIRASFFNILEGKSGSVPHTHITSFDQNQGLIKRKFSLVYYLSVGDQNSNEPGTFKLEEPDLEILPTKGQIIIIPAERKHSAVYNGKTDRIMIGVNFYSLK